MLTQGSMDVFRPLAFGLAATIAAITPAFPATSLVRERQRGTLSMLLHSPLPATSLYMGKFLGNCALAAILISASLPATAAAYTLGGLSMTSHILPFYAVLLIMIVVLSAVGLWISSISLTVDSALRWTYGAVLVLTILTLTPSLLWTASSGWVGTVAGIMRSVSPLSAVQEIVGQSAVGGDGLLASSGWILPYAASSLVISLVAGAATLARLRPNALERSRATGRITDEQSTGVKIFRRIAYLVDPQRRKSGIPLLLNPVMVKEFRTRRFGRIHWLIRLVALCAVISLGLTVVTATRTVAWGPERIVAAMVVLQLALLLLLGPSLGAGLISGELESGGWVQLRMSPMSSWRIVWGKLMSVLWTLALILLATLPGYVAMAFIQPELSTQLIHVCVSLAITSLMILAVSACVSAFNRYTATSTATSYGVLLALLAGTFLVWAARDKPFGKDIVERALMLNPAAGALSEMRLTGFETYDLIPQTWWISLTITAVCLFLLGVQTWRLTRPS